MAGRAAREAVGRIAQFRLPDLGEGLTEGEILRWLVAEGDTVSLNQPIVEVETAKAAVEVPSPYAGLVTHLHCAAGDVVDVGVVIISVDTEPGAGPVESAAGRDVQVVGTEAEARADVLPAIEAGKIGGEAPGGRTAVLVGYGPRSGPATRRARTTAPVVPPVAADPQPPPATAARVSAAAVGQAAARSTGGLAVLAKPPVRKLAKELGVDLAGLIGTGPHGTVTRADVTAAGERSSSPDASTSPDPSARETRIPIRGMRRHTAAAMVSSAFTAPHVTEFLTLDMTPSMDLLVRLKALPDFQGVKLSPLLLVARALLLAVRRHPAVNATWDEAAQEIVVKQYVNLGIAASTARGLVVPNIKDADALSLVELANAFHALTETAREGRTSPADMTHGTITITNVGMFGVDSGTPIINPGESAILCFGAVRAMPWVHEGELAVRQVTQLALSFDHRNIDGQLGSQFLSDIGRVLADPTVALAWS